MWKQGQAYRTEYRPQPSVQYTEMGNRMLHQRKVVM